MKARSLMCFIAMFFFVALAMTVRLPAQGQQEGQKKEHTRFKLVDLGTFGGPNSGNNGESVVMNSGGAVTGFADTPTPDPYFPNCFGDCFVEHAFEWSNGVLTDLGPIPGGSSSYTNAINSQDQIVGQSQNGLIDPITGIPEFVAAVWQDGRVIDLGTFGGGFSLATMNNNGQQVVGCAFNDIPDSFTTTNVFYGIGFEPRQLRAFRWQGKQLQDLGTLGGSDACAVWVNHRGQITGASFTNSIVNPPTGLPTLDPFLWENGRMLDLGTLGGTVGLAFMVNNRGQVIGQSSLAETPGACITGFAGALGCHGFLWDKGILTDLGTLGGNFSIPNWINDAGEVAGVASNQNEQTVFGFVWKKGVMTKLGSLDGDCGSQAFAINSEGQVVGQSLSCDPLVLPRAVLWEKEGPALDLSTLVNPGSGLQLTDPKIINDAGNIVLEGFLSNGDMHSVLLIPCEDGDHDCGHADEGAAAIQGTPAVVTQAPATAARPGTALSGAMAAIRARMASRSRRFGMPQPPTK